MNASASLGRERASHQARTLPDLWLMIVRFRTLCGARDGAIVASSDPSWLELGVWLARSQPSDVWRNCSIEKTVPRDSM